MLTKEELIHELAVIAEVNADDPESGHADADRALLRFINDPEITAAYEAVYPKWYG